MTKAYLQGILQSMLHFLQGIIHTYFTSLATLSVVESN